MQEKVERWMELCAQAAVEQDPDKLLALVKEINDLLEAKERRLGILPPKPNSRPSNRCGRSERLKLNIQLYDTAQ